jgi:hypothetical protein
MCALSRPVVVGASALEDEAAGLSRGCTERRLLATSC